MESKKNLLIDDGVWREIRKAAIDCDKTIGEFITMLFVRWKEGQHDYGNPTYSAGGPKDRKHRS